jgi:hypothetical protein
MPTSGGQFRAIHSDRSPTLSLRLTWHAEYNIAKKQNQVPWADLEGGVLMEQEIGHGESCAALTGRGGLNVTFSDGSSYADPKLYQTWLGGMEGKTRQSKLKRVGLGNTIRW